MLKVKKYPKRSPYYVIRGSVAGITVYETTETTDRTQAERYRIKREKELYDGHKLGDRPPVQIADAMIAYLDAGGEERFIKPLNEYFKERLITEIGQAEIDKCARALHPGCKPATMVRQVYGPMIAVLRHAVTTGMEGATLKIIKTPEVAIVPPQWANDEHVERLLAECDDRLVAWVLVSTNTGLRASEMIRQRAADHKLRPGWIMVGRTKNGEPAFVPIDEACQAAVAAILPEDPNAPVYGYGTVQGVNKALKAAAKRASVPYLSTHKIGRHSFAARLFGSGYDIKTVKEAGRWKKIQTVDERYGHLEKTAVHDVMINSGFRAKSVQSKKKAVG